MFSRSGGRTVVSLFRISIELASLRQPLKRALATASQLGADAVEIDARNELRPTSMTATGLRQFRKMLEELRLKVSSVSFPTHRGYDVEDDLDRRIEATKRAMDFAYSLGARVVTNAVGRIPSEETAGSGSTLREALTDIGRHGQHCGAFLAARTGSEDPALLQQLIDSLPDGSLFVDFDPGNLIVNGFSAADGLAVLSREILHVHACDGVRDLAQGRGLQVPLGRGSVDFCALLAGLDQGGYRGYLTIARRQAEDPVSEIGDAISYLREIQA